MRDPEEILAAAATVPERVEPDTTYRMQADGIPVPAGFLGHLHQRLGGLPQADSPALRREIAGMLFSEEQIARWGVEALLNSLRRASSGAKARHDLAAMLRLTRGAVVI